MVMSPAPTAAVAAATGMNFPQLLPLLLVLLLLRPLLLEILLFPQGCLSDSPSDNRLKHLVVSPLLFASSTRNLHCHGRNVVACISCAMRSSLSGSLGSSWFISSPIGSWIRPTLDAYDFS